MPTTSPSLALALALCASALGCAGPPPPPAPTPVSSRRSPQPDDPVDAARLAAAVVVGQVSDQEDGPAGRRITIQVRELVSADVDDQGRPVLADGDAVTVSSFLFRGSRPGELGPLEDGARYLFFLAPAERPGEWLNVADAAQHRLPDARATVERIRRGDRRRGDPDAFGR